MIMIARQSGFEHLRLLRERIQATIVLLLLHTMIVEHHPLYPIIPHHIPAQRLVPHRHLHHENAAVLKEDTSSSKLPPPKTLKSHGKL
jgi:hypothetical protein